MPPKSTAGFTKSAQKLKYIRNRDIKLNNKEIKEEERIKRGMSEGLCQRCSEKLQWRFQFNKYKPLKTIANCQGCKKKCITKAYRTLCDECGRSKNVCPSCCQDFHILLTERKERNNYLGINDEVKVDKEGEEEEEKEGNDGGGKISINDDEEEMEEVINNENENNEEEEREGEGEDGEDEEEEADDNMMEEPGTKRVFQNTTIEQTSSTIFTGTITDWNSRKFDDIAATKYSKARVTGSHEDNLQSGVLRYEPTLQNNNNEGVGGEAVGEGGGGGDEEGNSSI